MRKLSTAAVLAFLSFAFTQASGSAPVDPADKKALDAVVRDLCPREIAMLGESATHGDGHTEAFKAALVERLVDQCGFTSVAVEASIYQFLAIARRLRNGQTVSETDIANAVGGLWKFYQEFQPLLPFLLRKAQAGQLTLEGIDDQLGQAGQNYANVDMITELSAPLPQPQRQSCNLALHRRISSDYPETAPYARSDQSEIVTCLSAMEAAAANYRTANPADGAERELMLSAIRRWINRDFFPTAEQIAARDQSMYDNFEALLRHSPGPHKIILWAATVHIAKEADPAWADPASKNFGSYVRQQYGPRAFALGFSSLAGSYREGRRDVHDQPPAPEGSLEAQGLTLTESNTRYLRKSDLAASGTVPAAVFRHAYETLPWANFLDGLVLFREEHPPTSAVK